MTLSAPTFTCPDRMGQIILMGIEEIIGRNEISSVFNQAALAEFDEPGFPRKRVLDFSFEMLPRVQSCLEQTYGMSAGRGLAIRSGRACFRHLLREFGAEMGLTDLEYRLLSLPARIKFSNQALAALINQQTGQRVEFGMDDQYLHWTIERSPINGEMRNEKSICHLTYGILQETLSWTSGGKIYQVEETHCIERGDPCCKIQIRKNPIN
jgi:predicted hydrocarbon binding protein